MKDNNLTILSNFATTSTSLNLIHCIEEFDSGRNNVYILDENGNYSGFAVTKNSFKRIWHNIDDSIVNVPSIQSSLDNQQKLQQVIQIFNKYPNLNEIPLIDNNQINAVVTKNLPKQPQGFIWSNIKDIYLSPDMHNYNKIYLSSLENKDIFDFYREWNSRLPLIPLSNDNVINAVHDENNLLIYSEDIFPDGNKLSINELWNKLILYALKQMTNFCYISQEYAVVNIKDVGNRALFIQNFDKGYYAVSVVDDNNNFIDTVIPSTFNKDFPKKNFVRWKDLYINYVENEDTIKFEIAKWCFGTSRRELPIIKNGKIVSAGRFDKMTISNTSTLQVRDTTFPPIYWNLIDDEVAKEFFNKCKKVLISSEYGNLAGFRERFKHIIDITVYDDSLLDKYLSGEFDMLIYGANVWSDNLTIKYSIRSIYDILLMEVIRRYLINNNVYCYFIGRNNAPIINNSNRIKCSTNIIKSSNPRFGGIYNDYVIRSDAHDGENWNVINGIRFTTGCPQKFNRSIHFFGPCIAIGGGVKDSQTIESILQKIINQNKISCKIFNYGMNSGFDGQITNMLYRVLDTNFNKEDIVIFLAMNKKNFAFKELDYNKYFLEDIFNDFKLKDLKIFRDKVILHTNEVGNKSIAEFLFKKLRPLLEKK